MALFKIQRYFATSEKLSKHANMNCENLRNKQLCGDCGKFYATKDSLTKHQRLYFKKSLNESLNLYRCSNCSKCFKTKGNFTKHKRQCNPSRN